MVFSVSNLEISVPLYQGLLNAQVLGRFPGQTLAYLEYGNSRLALTTSEKREPGNIKVFVEDTWQTAQHLFKYGAKQTGTQPHIAEVHANLKEDQGVSEYVFVDPDNNRIVIEGPMRREKQAQEPH